MVISSGDAACSFYCTFVAITFTKCKPVASEKKRITFSKTIYMFTIFVNISITELISSKIPTIKGTGFYNFFLSQEK